MLHNFTKIVIKYSSFLFVSFGAMQEIYSMDEGDGESHNDSSRVAYISANKENLCKRLKVGNPSPPRKRGSSRRALQLMRSPRLHELGYGNFQVIEAGELALAGESKVSQSSSIHKKRPRDVAPSFQEEKSLQNEESQLPTLSSALGESEALEVQMLNAALYKPEVTHEKVDLKYFTPTKVNGYRNAGGKTPELRSKIGVVKALYPRHIQDTENFPRDDTRVFSPAVRNLPREVVANLRELKLVLHLPDYATAEPIAVETEEERAERKERQKKEFEASEATLGNFPKHLDAEIEIALKPWVPYFNYVELTKKQYLEGLGNKLKWPDLVGAFLKYVAPHMERLEIEGYEVYFSLKTLNFKRVNWKNKKPNHFLMEDGLCPVGAPDGLSMNWHHVLRIDVHSHKVKVTEAIKINHEGPYKLVLIPAFIHTEYTGFLHPEHYISPQNEIDRGAFGASRKVINQIIRAKYYHGD